LRTGNHGTNESVRESGDTNAEATLSSTIKIPRFPARLNLSGVEVSATILRSFEQWFKTRKISVSTTDPSRQANSQPAINACVVSIKRSALLELRKLQWFATGEGLLYGIGDADEVSEFPDLRLNVLLENSMESSIRAAVDRTAALVSRRSTVHDRVPIVAGVTIDTATRLLTGLTVNVGCGGMAVRLHQSSELPRQLTTIWKLPGIPPLSLLATPRWNSGRVVGLQFVSHTPDALKHWISTYSARLISG
jgi:hypothetical protein